MKIISTSFYITLKKVKKQKINEVSMFATIARLTQYIIQYYNMLQEIAIDNLCLNFFC